jgi:hypothetical protein
MSISNIERMVEGLIRDEMNYIQSLPSRGEMLEYVEELVRAKWESADNDIIIEEYERLA